MQRFAFLGLVVVVLASASITRADFQPTHLVRTPSGPVCQRATMCTHPTDCVDPDTCQTVIDPLGVTGMACLRDTSTEIFCCAVTTDCPSFDGPVRCVHAPMTAGTALGLCLYGDRSYCITDTTTLGTDGIDHVIACHTSAINPCTDPLPGMPSAFDQGDCDHDGIANVADPNLCTPDSTMCSDAGTPIDGGNASDAGTPDLGTGAMDASAPLPPGVSFRGGAGCNCSVANGESGTGALALAGMLVALVVQRRRQSQR